MEKDGFLSFQLPTNDAILVQANDYYICLYSTSSRDLKFNASCGHDNDASITSDPSIGGLGRWSWSNDLLARDDNVISICMIN